MFRAWFPFDATTTTGFSVATTFQALLCLSCSYNICFVEVIGVWVINQATLHLHVIKVKFENLGMDRTDLQSETDFQRTMETQIDQLIRDHNHVILYITYLCYLEI